MLKTLIKSKKFYLFLAIGLLAAFGLFRYRQSRDPNRFNPKNDQVVSPVRQDIKEQIVLAGAIDSENKAELRFPTSGRLVWLGVKVGDSVRKWQSVASLDRQELNLQYQKLMTDYLTNRWNFEDTQDEYKTTKDKYLVTDEIKRILERSQFSLNNAVADVELKNLAIRNATLSSPISGIVTAVDQPTSGVNVTSLNFAVNIVDPQSLFFLSEIDQDEVTKIRINQPAEVRIDSFPDTVFSSQITYIAFTPVAGESSTVYQVRFSLPIKNPDLTYRLGMDGDAAITLAESTDTLTIPIDAVLNDGSTDYVWVKTGQLVRKQAVTTGLENDTDIEITEGLTEKDELVIRKK